MCGCFVINTSGYRLDRLPSGLWRLQSPRGCSYTIDPQEGTCTCPDGQIRGADRVCKHVKAIWNLLRLVPWLRDW